ncbi:putative membrane protein [Wickerhamomyces ciferrii]|uniref:Membrane protein n=1 Tax=Wickerhamomyces ciferrii (strain ATCC 14091 / BCRC 22168 / CBS 111 / JCM 3599 / NBRC 0793 / NRRL Y-1031 F-60-10) TaxID=1206466 RepID=K0KK57_WICCF|nr:uncharacterized protein BN7_2101 [Wickerhamomyces ciferrii]CCH42557.1 putative membrane protein [Wickerhamomyces ciferrii]
MIFDNHLIPIAEFCVSIVIPLILTLKTLEVTNKAPKSTKDTTYSIHILRYWLTYWFLLCFIQYGGVNNHMRLFFSLFYASQYRAISPYLVEFYRSTLLPRICYLCFKVLNLQVSEEEVDNYSIRLLEQTCFNNHLFERIFSLLRLGKSKSSSWSLEKTIVKSPRSRNPSNSIQTKDSKSNNRFLNGENVQSAAQNIVPLEIQKTRSRKSSVTRSTNNTNYDSKTDPKRFKKRSSDNLRSKSSSSSLSAQVSGSQSRGTSRSLNSRHVSNENYDSSQVEAIPTIDDIAYAVSNHLEPTKGPFTSQHPSDSLSPSSSSPSTHNTITSQLLDENKNKSQQERAPRLKGFFV